MFPSIERGRLLEVGSMSLMMQFSNMRMKCIYIVWSSLFIDDAIWKHQNEVYIHFFIQCCHWCQHYYDHPRIMWKYCWWLMYNASWSGKIFLSRNWLCISSNSLVVQCIIFWVRISLHIGMTFYNCNYNFELIRCNYIQYFVTFCKVFRKIWMTVHNLVYHSYLLYIAFMWEIWHFFTINYSILW